MAEKIYQGDVGTRVVVDCLEDLASASNTSIKVKKPDGTEANWVASILGNTLVYITVADDLDQVGIYEVQASITLAGWVGLGETDSFYVNAPFG